MKVMAPAPTERAALRDAAGERRCGHGAQPEPQSIIIKAAVGAVALEPVRGPAAS